MSTRQLMLQSRSGKGKTRTLLLIGALIGAPAAPALAESLAWVQRTGGPGNEGVGGAFSRYSGDHVAVDPAGNVYVAGSYERGARFAEGDVEHDPAGGRDLFVAKFDRGGTLAWVRSAGGRGDDDAHAVAVDDRGNAYVTGHFTGRATFGAGEPRETRVEAREQQIFVAKYASDGTLAWARQVRGATRDRSNAGVGIGVDASGAAYVTGTFHGVAQFHTGRPDLVPALSSVLPEVFFAKYDTNGEALWVRQARGLSVNYAESIAVSPAGESVAIGRFRGLVTFGSGRRQITLSAFTGEESFAVKLGSDGRVVWAVQAEDGERTQRFHDVALGAEGTTLLVGTSAAEPSGPVNGFVRKLDAEGEVTWSRRFGGRPAAVAVASTGGVILTGSFEGEAVFDAEGEATATLRAAEGRDAFYAGYRTDGSFAWAYLLATGPGDQAGGGIAIDGSDHRYLVGGHEQTTTFLPGDPRSTERTSVGGSDLFVTKVTRFAP